MSGSEPAAPALRRYGASARLRFGLAFAGLVLLALAGLGALAGKQARTELERNSGFLLAQVAARVSVTLDTGVQERMREIANLALLESLLQDEVSPDGWRSLIDRLQTSVPHYSWVGVADTQGLVLAATGRLLEGRNVSARPWFVQGARQSFIGGVHDAVLLQSLLPPNPTGEPLRLIDFAAPLLRNGKPYGVVGAHLSMAWAEEKRQQALRSVPADRRMEILVVDPEGQVVLGPARPAPPMLGRGDAPAMLAWGDGARYLTAVGAADHSGGLGWRVVVREPEDVALAAAHQIERHIWGLGLVAAVLFGLAGWWLAGLLTGPLRRVAQQARQLSGATGQSLPQAYSGPRDEVAQLDDSLRSLVDELQQRERQLLALNQRLEDRIAERTLALSQANADLRSFSRSVAHDVKGPIGAIGMVLRNLASERSEPLTVGAPRVLPMVITECDRLGVLVDELLMLSMVDEREMQCQAVDMGELADAVLVDLRQSGPGQRVVFQREPLPVVQGDPVLLRQVWQNLLGNAVRFSARQDSPCVQVRARRDGDQWVFEVQDNGVGFDMAQAGRLFGAFQRLHRNADFPGTGVGLSIVKRVVHRHGGRVGAESQPGAGACFHFSLPAPDAAPAVQK